MTNAEQQAQTATKTADTENSINADLTKGGAMVTTELKETIPPESEWKQWGQTAKDILSKLPDYIGDFISNNQRPIVSLGLIFGGIVTLKLTLAILDAINDIPLLAPSFELVGIGYTSWFVYRYLLQASTRQELSEEIDKFKAQIVGDSSQDS